MYKRSDNERLSKAKLEVFESFTKDNSEAYTRVGVQSLFRTFISGENYAVFIRLTGSMYHMTCVSCISPIDCMNAVGKSFHFRKYYSKCHRVL